MSNTWTTSGRRGGRRESARGQGGVLRRTQRMRPAREDRTPHGQCNRRDVRWASDDDAASRRWRTGGAASLRARASIPRGYRGAQANNCVCTSLGGPIARVVVGAAAAATRAPRTTSFSQLFHSSRRAAEKFDRCARVHERAASPAHRPPPRRRVAARPAVAPSKGPCRGCPPTAATKPWPTEPRSRRRS